MRSALVIEVDVFGNGCFEFFFCTIHIPVHLFFFKGRKESFQNSIIVGLSRCRKGLFYMIAFQNLPKNIGGILAALIAVKKQTLRVMKFFKKYSLSFSEII